jgi:hypothetical protein
MPPKRVAKPSAKALEAKGALGQEAEINPGVDLGDRLSVLAESVEQLHERFLDSNVDPPEQLQRGSIRRKAPVDSPNEAFEVDEDESPPRAPSPVKKKSKLETPPSARCADLQFANLGALLYAETHGTPMNFAFPLPDSGLVDSKSLEAKPIESSSDWAAAFGCYLTLAAVHPGVDPNVIKELRRYQVLVLSWFKKFRFDAVIDCDLQWRRLIASRPDRFSQFANVDQALVANKLNTTAALASLVTPKALAAPRSSSSRSASSSSSASVCKACLEPYHRGACTSKTRACWAWNDGRLCKNSPSAVSEQQTQASTVESKQTQDGVTPPTQLPEGFVVVE